MKGERVVRDAAMTLLLVAAAGGGAAQDAEGGPDPRFLVPRTIPRLALVIGVQNYDHLDTPVPNADNDARAVLAALVDAGFKVDYLPDPATNDQILTHVKSLAMKAGGASEPAAVVLFFAGHGFQSGGFNYLVPRSAMRSQLFEDSVPVSSVLRLLSGRAGGVNVLFLDACRTAGHVRDTTQEPSGEPPGFATVATKHPGTIVGMAAKYDKPARSRATAEAQNSPYSDALSRYIRVAGLSVEEMFNKVQNFVEQVTGNEQSPEEADSLAGAFFFRPTERERTAEEQAWLATLRTNRLDCIQMYAKSYPDSRFLRAALEWAAHMPSESVSGGGMCPDM
jgi:uncharacterized caspase-like protein